LEVWKFESVYVFTLPTIGTRKKVQLVGISTSSQHRQAEKIHLNNSWIRKPSRHPNVPQMAGDVLCEKQQEMTNTSTLEGWHHHFLIPIPYSLTRE